MSYRMSKQEGTSARNTKVMNRFDLTSRLVAMLKNEEAVIGGIGNTNFDLWAAGHRPQNFYMLGSMGLAFPIALGVALAQPKRRVFALEGDGSLLMQLGCLSTIATLKPKNLSMIVMDNGIYQITGAQPTPAAAVSDLIAVAIGCGLTNSAWAADEEDFERLVDQSLTASEPMLIGVHRRQAGYRNHPSRSRPDQGALHARARRARSVVTCVSEARLILCLSARAISLAGKASGAEPPRLLPRETGRATGAAVDNHDLLPVSGLCDFVACHHLQRPHHRRMVPSLAAVRGA